MILLIALAGAVWWALARRHSAGAGWRDAATQAETDGTALHDAAVGELIAAGTANRPHAWSGIADGADALAAALGQLEGGAPDEDSRRLVSVATGALAGLRSAVGIAANAPPDTPLDEAARDTLRERLEELSSALRALKDIIV